VRWETWPCRGRGARRPLGVASAGQREGDEGSVQAVVWEGERGCRGSAGHSDAAKTGGERKIFMIYVGSRGGAHGREGEREGSSGSREGAVVELWPPQVVHGCW
jgi:hypothetical protein